VLEELRVLVAARTKILGDKAGNIIGLGLSARRNMCTHPTVSKEPSRESVDRACRELTAPWVREQGGQSGELCDAHEKFQTEMADRQIPSGIYTLADMRQFSEGQGWCPYFVARHAITLANVVVYNYGYLLDPKIANLISKDLAKESIVVFDEAHNIDNVCIEVMSVTMKQDTLDSCAGNVSTLKAKISDMSEHNAKRLQDEYERLLTGLASAAGVDGGMLGSPLLPASVLEEAVPGNIRQAKTFVELMGSLVYELKQKLAGANSASQESTYGFLHRISDNIGWEAKAMSFCSERLRSLLRTLEVVDVDEYTPLTLVADFATLLASYTSGFTLLLEPYDERYPDVPDPTLQLACVDASIAIKPILERFQTVVLTSGTISIEENLYPKILQFVPVTSKSIPLTLERNGICPLVVSKGSDQVELTSSYNKRGDEGVLRNYGSLLLQMAQVVPDGIIVFFVSYISMEQMIAFWNSDGHGE
jgi:DNA excision repair protein ERCC-2